SAALVLIERRAAEALRDELLQPLLLLVQARARHQQHAVARCQARDDFAVFEIGKAGLHSDGNRLIALLHHDPVVAAEEIARVLRSCLRGRGAAGTAENEYAAAGKSSAGKAAPRKTAAPATAASLAAAAPAPAVAA